MRDDRLGYENADQGREVDGLGRSGSEHPGSAIEKKYWISLALYAVLAVLGWFTMGAGTVLVQGKPVELRYLPLIILGGLALRTVVAYWADRIRRGR